eukprot:4591527-Prorocentrum_lima.AAC.1
MPWRVLCALPRGSRDLVATMSPMNLPSVVGKGAHMRRTLTRMGVEADEWFDAVTGRRREGL